MARRNLSYFLRNGLHFFMKLTPELAYIDAFLDHLVIPVEIFKCCLFPFKNLNDPWRLKTERLL